MGAGGRGLPGWTALEIEQGAGRALEVELDRVGARQGGDPGLQGA